MRQTRFTFVAVLAVAVLLAAGCGGDEAAEEPEDTAQTGSVSDAATDDPAEEPEPEAEPEPVVVHLGDQFSWCAEMQANWDRYLQAQVRVDEAEVALLREQERFEAAHSAATRSGVHLRYEGPLVVEAERHLEDVVERLVAARADMAGIILPGSGGSTEAQTIALGRAREVFRLNADRELLSSSELAHGVDWSAADLTAPADEAPAADSTRADSALDLSGARSSFANVFGGGLSAKTREAMSVSGEDSYLNAYAAATKALLADTAGMAAFWGSLGESCEM